MTAEPPNHLTGCGITVIRAGRRVLDDVDVEARPAGVLAITGASGSGKSTLLSVLAGLVQPDAGTIHRAVAARDRQGTGVVLQGYGLLPVLTATENVELALQVHPRPRDEIARRAAEALRRVGLGDLDDRLTEELSGGQQQRVAVARALVTGPALLVADEPTAELDEYAADLIIACLRSEADAGATVVLATHDPAIADLADDQLHLVDGRAAR